jgi:gas vesicle protein
MPAIAVLAPQPLIRHLTAKQDKLGSIGRLRTQQHKIDENDNREIMSNREGFTGGFLTGVLLGGAIGTVAGLVLGSRRGQEEEEDELLLNSQGSQEKASGNQEQAVNPENLEANRRNLENKIAQLNEAIDEVRQQLHSVDRSAADTESEYTAAEDS